MTARTRPLAANRRIAALHQFTILAATVATHVLLLAGCHPMDSDSVSVGASRAALDVTGLAWMREQELSGPNGSAFGNAVALSGDTLLVGAFWEDAAYVYVWTGTTWTYQAEFTGPASSYLGTSVALQGDTAIVGAPGGWSSGYRKGAANVYVRQGTTWSIQAALQPSDVGDTDFFGGSVAIDGDTAIVGARGDDDGGSDAGSAQVFVRTGTTWSRSTTLTGIDTGSGDEFGTAVAISGDVILVGASRDNLVEADAGSAYLFRRDGTGWTHEAKLTAPDASYAARFGYAVAVDGDTAMVGAPYSNARGSQSGSSYVFARSGIEWPLQAELGAPDVNGADNSGMAVALRGDVAVVGTPWCYDSTTFTSGAAHVFVRNGTTWTFWAKLGSPPNTVDLRNGAGVAVGPERIVVGAPNDSGAGNGFIVSYALRRSNGMACTGGAECQSGYCVDGVCCDQACGAGAANDCMACSEAAGAAEDGFCGPVPASPALLCRPSVGACDSPEVCDGVSTSCPTDQLAPAGTTCRAADPDSVCDVSEVCDGLGGTCPPDGFASAGTVCRAAESACDQPETCSGSEGACPADVEAPDGTACSDGSACTEPDVCGVGACVPGPAVGCDDGNPCTEDSCDPSSGCLFVAVADGTACDDGSSCTSADHCATGRCVGAGLDCDDGNACTQDGCDALGACTHDAVPDGSGCTDGDACTAGDACLDGGCVPGSPLDCSDENPCTTDQCSPSSGCTHDAASDGTPCTGGACRSGICAPEGAGGSGGGGGEGGAAGMSPGGPLGTGAAAAGSEPAGRGGSAAGPEGATAGEEGRSGGAGGVNDEGTSGSPAAGADGGPVPGESGGDATDEGAGRAGRSGTDASTESAGRDAASAAQSGVGAGQYGIGEDSGPRNGGGCGCRNAEGEPPRGALLLALALIAALSRRQRNGGRYAWAKTGATGTR